jgi:NADH-quinone oxidoreductase subunit J
MIVQAVFWFFGILLIGAAVMVVTVRNPVHAALFLVLAFFSSAAIWLLLHAEFLAIALVLVYVGAVMVLFLFVVMMLDINLAPLREGFARYLPVGIVVAIAMAVAMGAVIWSGHFDVAPAEAAGQPGDNNTLALGRLLYTEFLYPFEIAGALLLVAIIAAIALALRPPRGVKTPVVSKQVQVKREGRIRLVDLKRNKA